MQVILGRNPITNPVMAIFSPQPLQKWSYFLLFRQSEESKCKNAQFLQCILKDDVVYFKKIIES